MLQDSSIGTEQTKAVHRVNESSLTYTQRWRQQQASTYFCPHSISGNNQNWRAVTKRTCLVRTWHASEYSDQTVLPLVPVRTDLNVCRVREMPYLLSVVGFTEFGPFSCRSVKIATLSALSVSKKQVSCLRPKQALSQCLFVQIAGVR